MDIARDDCVVAQADRHKRGNLSEPISPEVLRKRSRTRGEGAIENVGSRGVGISSEIGWASCVSVNSLILGRLSRKKDRVPNRGRMNRWSWQAQLYENLTEGIGCSAEGSLVVGADSGAAG